MSAEVLRRAARGLGSPPRARAVSASDAPSYRTVPLAPREHGTYGQLVLPLVVAHVTGSTTWAAWLFTTAAVAAFLSHEPLLITLGKRGDRARIQSGPRALRFLFATAGVGWLAAIAGLALGPSPARWSALGCAVLAIPIAAQIARGADRSLLGELLVASMLPALAVPVALSARVPTDTAIGVWLVWTLGFAAATCAVRDVVARFKRGRPLHLRLAPLAVAAVLAGSALALGLLQRMQVAAVTPLLVTPLAIAVWPPHPRHLRRVGWILLLASATTAALLIA